MRGERWWLIIAAVVCMACMSEAFTASTGRRNKHQAASLKMAKKGVTGSFFNPVPEKDDDDNKEGGEKEGDDIDRSISELMKQRKATPRAKSPSTLGGVPTSKATGFGKVKEAKKKPQEYIEIGPKGEISKVDPFAPKYTNDVNNPEYDDQGYTLHTNEVTGEKKRVFEALVDYPCDFTMKIVGRNEGAFVLEIVQVVADSCEVGIEDVPYSKRDNGKWTSVTVHAPVKDAEMLYTLYENVDRDPRVKFKF
mmetsp:Transcript_33482/g.49034  ORF Transcript_33482/g.49034 Transcript_33482/m.49034 type:complete len:251 (-) Transcript_33482:29-781(-)